MPDLRLGKSKAGAYGSASKYVRRYLVSGREEVGRMPELKLRPTRR